MNVWVTSAQHFWQAGGTLMPALFLLAFGIWYLSLSLYVPLARTTCLVKDLRAGNGGPCGPSVRSTGCPPPGHAGDDHLRKRQLAELHPYERDLRILRALVAAAPLVGLLGTVKGMIATFITLSGHGSTPMELLSVGISEALITTQVGLVIAIPGLVGIHASARKLAQLKNVFDRLALHAETSPCLPKAPGGQAVAR